MTTTHFRGPVFVSGVPPVASGFTSSTSGNPEAAPSLFFQGGGVADPRVPYTEGTTGLGKLYGYYSRADIPSLDMVPATLSTTKIAAAQTVTAATPMTLQTTAAYGLSTLMKIVPSTANRVAANQVSVSMLDAGFGSVTIVAASATFSSFLHYGIGGTSLLYVGMPVWIAGAGTAGAPHFTRVATITSATAGTFTDAAVTSVTAQAIGSADENLVTPEPFIRYGADRLFDQFQGCARAVNVATAAGAANQNITINGYDIYNTPMTEVIAAVASTTVNGKKAFKSIFSAVPTSTDATASAYSVGTTDIYGFAVRTDRQEYTEIYMNAAQITAATGWLTADITSPATTTTGDVRGTYAVQTASNGSAVGTGRRLLLTTRMPVYQMAAAVPGSVAPMFGVTQV